MQDHHRLKEKTMEKIKIDALMDSKQGFNQSDCDQGALPELQE